MLQQCGAPHDSPPGAPCMASFLHTDALRHLTAYLGCVRRCLRPPICPPRQREVRSRCSASAERTTAARPTTTRGSREPCGLSCQRPPSDRMQHLTESWEGLPADLRSYWPGTAGARRYTVLNATRRSNPYGKSPRASLDAAPVPPHASTSEACDERAQSAPRGSAAPWPWQATRGVCETASACPAPGGRIRMSPRSRGGRRLRRRGAGTPAASNKWKLMATPQRLRVGAQQLSGSLLRAAPKSGARVHLPPIVARRTMLGVGDWSHPPPRGPQTRPRHTDDACPRPNPSPERHFGENFRATLAPDVGPPPITPPIYLR